MTYRPSRQIYRQSSKDQDWRELYDNLDEFERAWVDRQVKHLAGNKNGQSDSQYSGVKIRNLGHDGTRELIVRLLVYTKKTNKRNYKILIGANNAS